MPKSFVLFDCDGVLVDSEFIASHVLADMLLKYGSPTTAKEIMTDYVGQLTMQIVTSLVNLHGLKLPTDFMDQFYTRLDVEMEENLLPIEGIAQVLKELALPRAVVSNSDLSRIKTSLKTTGLDLYFDPNNLFSPDVALYSKPDPRIYQYAVDKVGVDKSQIIVVEDSPTGVSAASGAGLEVIGFLGATHATENAEEKLRSNGAKYIAHHSAELSVLLKEICA
jgi:HAD superfamily hydrolase (TIGR01509 family)